MMNVANKIQILETLVKLEGMMKKTRDRRVQDAIRDEYKKYADILTALQEKERQEGEQQSTSTTKKAI